MVLRRGYIGNIPKGCEPRSFNIPHSDLPDLKISGKAADTRATPMGGSWGSVIEFAGAVELWLKIFGNLTAALRP
jgi:hypothetical protein